MTTEEKDLLKEKIKNAIKISSQKLIEKLGMTFKKFIKIPNDDEELMLYEIDNFFNDIIHK